MKKLLLASLVLLSACSSLPDWLGAGTDDAPLPGERIAVIDSSIKLSPDADTAAETVPVSDAKADLSAYKTYTLGEPASEKHVLINPPLIADGKLFAVDGLGNVMAFKLGSFEKLWTNNAIDENADEDADEKELPGGGLAYGNGIVYATRGDGSILALSADNGAVVWKKNLGAAIRQNPTVGEDKVFAATADNQLFALNLVDGTTVWRHSGSTESTINYGSPAPVFKDGSVVIAYTSGEVFGINAARGSELWDETVSIGAERRKTAATFVDVSASPVLVDGMSYIGSQNGSLIAFNTGNGYRIWEQRIGSIEYTPVVLDKFIFAIGDNARVVALNRNDGKVKWSAELPPKADTKDNTRWGGPVIIGSSLVAVSSKGQLAVYDVNSGQMTGLKDAPANVFAAPVASGNNLYLYDREANLAVY